MGYIDIKLDKQAQAQLESNYAYIASVFRTNEAKKIFRRGFSDILKPTKALAKTLTRKGTRPLGLNRLRKGGLRVQRLRRVYQIVRIRQIKRKIVGARVGYIGSKRAGIRYPQLLAMEHGSTGTKSGYRKFYPANAAISQSVRLTVRSHQVLREMEKSIAKTLRRKRAKRINIKRRDRV